MKNKWRYLFATVLFLAVNSMAKGPQGPLIGVTIDDVTPIDSIISSLSQIIRKSTARVVFDFERSPYSYKSALMQITKVSYVMGQIADSSEMKNISVEGYRLRTRIFREALKDHVDIWEIGNEINGLWLGPDAFEKSLGAFQEIQIHQDRTALTFFYEGEPSDPVNCIEAPGSDMFSWIEKHFELKKDPKKRNPEREKMRLGLSYVFVSWYPDQCHEIKPDWQKVFSKLAHIFPHSQVGFGEISPEKPQFGSEYEKNLIREFYGMTTQPPLHERFVGGYFWWHFVAEMVPANKTPLLDLLNKSITPLTSTPVP